MTSSENCYCFVIQPWVALLVSANKFGLKLVNLSCFIALTVVWGEQQYHCMPKDKNWVIFCCTVCKDYPCIYAERIECDCAHNFQRRVFKIRVWVSQSSIHFQKTATHEMEWPIFNNNLLFISFLFESKLIQAVVGVSKYESTCLIFVK